MADSKFPESYKDATYASLDARTEQKLGLPAGLLSNIRERGEKSNHSQVSEAKAAGVYQFIPSTRKAILDKYGIDVTLNPQNASEGAGLLLKEGLDRNKGDAAAAVAEYHAGPDRSFWGPRTRAYVNRVMTGMRGAEPTSAPPSGGSQVAPRPGGSTFDKVLAAMPQAGVSGPKIDAVYRAYTAGQLSPENAAQFESDVKSGLVLLPRGAKLPGAAAREEPKTSAVKLPDTVAQAYLAGAMSEENRAQLEDDVRTGLVQHPLIAPVRKVGALETAARVAGNAARPAVKLAHMAAAGGAGIVGAEDAQNAIFANMRDVDESMRDLYAEKQGERFSTAGKVAGTVASIPGAMIAPGAAAGINRATEVIDRAGSLADAAKAGAASATVDLASMALPAAAGLRAARAAGAAGTGVVRSTATGAATGAGINVPAGIAGRAVENAALPAGQQYVDLRQDPVSQEALLTDATLSAAFGGVGGRAAHTSGRASGVGAATTAPTAPAGATASAGAPKPQTVAQRTIDAIAQPISSVTGKVRAALGSSEPKATAGTKGSGGAAGTDVATLRRANAQDLPVPIDLTEGQATRTLEQARFERETAKNPTHGAPLRERFEQQNEQILQNFEHFIDQTGGQAPNLRAVGSSVDSALSKQYSADKARVNAAYAKARKSEEAKAVVDTSRQVAIGEGETATTSTPFQFINEQPTGVPTSGLIDAARQYAVKLGIAENVDGQLVPRSATVAQLEEWRKAIGNSVNSKEATDIRSATILKKLIDGQTEPVAGPLYRDARNLRARLAQNYEDRSVINRLMSKKPGTEDRSVALEDVFSHAILDGSLDDVRNVRRVLQRGGDLGQQAWRDLQGQTLTHLRDEMTKNVARDGRGNQIVSASALDKALKKLDADGKLDFVFGKQGAERLRTVNEVAKDVLTTTPGAVNHSNTASVLAAALDMGMTGAVGVPLPVASGLRMLANQVKDKRVAARVRQALGDDARKEPSKF